MISRVEIWKAGRPALARHSSPFDDLANPSGKTVSPLYLWCISSPGRKAVFFVFAVAVWHNTDQDGEGSQTLDGPE